MASGDKLLSAEMTQLRQQASRSRELQAQRRRLGEDLVAGIERLAEARLTTQGLSVELRLAALRQRRAASIAHLLRPLRGRLPPA